MLCNASFHVLSQVHALDINYTCTGYQLPKPGKYGGPCWRSRCSWSGDRIPEGGEIFRTRPDRPCGPPSHLYSGYRSPRRSVDHPPPSSAEIKERVERYFCSPSGPSWLLVGPTLPGAYLRISFRGRGRSEISGIRLYVVVDTGVYCVVGIYFIR